MKLHFDDLFLIFAVIVFIGSGKSVASCILLLCAGLYMGVDAISGIVKWRHDNGKR